MKKYLRYIKEDYNEIESIIKNYFMEDNDNDWESVVDDQELGDCQSIVSGIMKLEILGIEKHFGEIQVVNATEDEYYDKIMTHHWVTYNGKILEFSKGTLKDFVYWDDIYSVSDDGEIDYNFNEIRVK